MTELQLRLKHCLETILEMEPAMNTKIVGKHFNMEFSILKNCLLKVDKMSLAEDDVKRLEIATANFLAEFKLCENTRSKPDRLLQ